MTFSSSYSLQRRLGRKSFRTPSVSSNTATLPVANPDLWLTVRNPSTVIVDGSNNVTAWNDSSSNGRNGSPSASVAAPTYGTIASKPALLFGQSGASVIDCSYSNSGTVVTAYIAYCLTVSGATVRIACISTSASTNAVSGTDRAALLSRNSGAANVRGVRNSTALSTSTGLSYDTWYVACSRWDGTNHYLRINTTDYTAVASTGTFAVTAARLGANTGATPVDPFLGGIGEFVIYNAFHDSTQVTNTISAIRTGLGI